ncbi:NhaC family Na+:H+ antiporter [Bacilli bacterium PM5-3]|nr:NhaC family Na+:H+ antiporter [Bacilli bacterium PM5-3]MDH6603633.1 NhaC family Na+:H+ antiporter [Bacilli bacterium PM5-9]
MNDDVLMPEVTSRRKIYGLIVLVLLVLFLYYFISVAGADPHLALISGTIAAAFFAVIDGTKWDTIEKGMMQSIMMAMQACIILLVIGMLIASWITGGVVQAMIYYGLGVINPKFFFVTAVLLSSIVALATGSSWTTAGTIGIALVGIAKALDINMAMAAGSIVSGAYFGDKMSPLSDTTNLAPALAGTTLFDHIKSMLYTTVPSYLIAIVMYIVLGFMVVKDAGADLSGIKALQDVLDSAFTINLLLLIPPCVIVGMVAFKLPAIPGLFLATALGIICTVAIQGVTDIPTIIGQLHYGYEFDGSTLPAADAIGTFFSEYSLVDGGTFYNGMEFFTAAPADGQGAMDVLDQAKAATLGFDAQVLLDIQALLTRGGLDSMLWTVSLILCAMCFGGAMEASGMLVSLVDSLKGLISRPWSLVLTSILTGFAVNILASDQYVSIVLPGRMYKDGFRKLNLAPRVQSRVLESGGTLTSALVPWNTCGATMSGFLGVNSFAYAPFAFFNLLNPAVEVIAAATGWAMFPDDGSDHIK